MNRLAMALVAFAALGVLAWTTLSDQRIRYGALVILAMFALKTFLHRKDVMRPKRGLGGEAFVDGLNSAGNPERSRRISEQEGRE